MIIFPRKILQEAVGLLLRVWRKLCKFIPSHVNASPATDFVSSLHCALDI